MKLVIWDAITPVVTGRFGSNFKSAIYEHMLRINFKGTFCEIILRWKPQNIFDGKSTLVNGLVPLGNKPSPEPMFNQIYVTIWHHQATMG